MSKRVDTIEAAKSCLALGVDPGHGEDTPSNRARNEVAYYLARDIQSLKALVRKRKLTLAALRDSKLLPTPLVSCRLFYCEKAKLDEAGRRLLNDTLRVLDDRDIERLSRYAQSGPQTVLQVKALKELYTATHGFRAIPSFEVVAKDLTVPEQDALIERIKQKVRTDPVTRMRLSQLFPA